MECYQIKELLTEYIDGMLDSQTLTTVEEHLHKCGGCNEEYLSLKALVNELGYLETVKAPKDFLKKTHERIEAGSWFDRIKRLLFFPARIKVPVELTALATTAVLVFIIFNMVQPEKQDKNIPSETSGNEIAIKGKTDPVEPTVKSDDLMEGRLIHLVLLLESESEEKPISSENVLFVTSGTEINRQDVSEFRFKTDQQKQPSSPSLQDDILTNINKIISPMEGRLLSKEYKNGDYLQYITLEIPTVNYLPFLKGIERYGSLQTPIPVLPEEYPDRIQLRIQITSSK